MAQNHSAQWRRRLLTATILLFGAALHSAFGQPLPGASGINGPRNPRVIVKYITVSRPGNIPNHDAVDSSKVSPAEAKRKAIEEAINEGNKARDSFDYPRALASYSRVSEQLDPTDARAFYGLGNLYSDLACTDTAINAYTAALRLNKDLPDALIALGHVYINKERYSDAEVQFRNVLKTTPNDAGARIGLAVISWKTKNFADALKQLRTVIDDQSVGNDDRAYAHLVLADYYLATEKWQESAAESKLALNLNPNLTVAYLELGLSELYPAMERFGSLADQEIRPEDNEAVAMAARRATEYFRTAINEHNFKHPNGNLFLAYGLIWQANFPDAENQILTYFSKIKNLEAELSAIAKNCDAGFAPLYARGYHALALIDERSIVLESDERKKSELLKKIVDNLKQVIELRPGDASAYSVLGLIYLRQSQYREAMDALNKAISLETNEKNKAWEYAGLGQSYYAIGRYEEAIDYFNKSIKIEPDISIHYVQLAAAYEKQGNFDEAIRFNREAIAREKEPRAHSYYFLATTYFRRAIKNGSDSDFEEAIRLSNKAVEINRSYASAYLMLGQIYKFYRGGARTEEAIRNFELALKYDPKNPLIPYSLGDLYLGVIHNNEAAIKYLTDAIALKPDYSEAYFFLGEAYRYKHENSAALIQFQNALKYNDNNLVTYLEIADTLDQEKRYSEAIEYLLKATGKFPTNFLPYKELARIYSHDQKIPEAIHYYEEAIKRVKPEESWIRELYSCRIERLRNNYAAAIKCYQEIRLPSSADPGQIIYDVGATYVASKNKKAAMAEYQRLLQLKSGLAEDLLKQINDIK